MHKRTSSNRLSRQVLAHVGHRTAEEMQVAGVTLEFRGVRFILGLLSLPNEAEQDGLQHCIPVSPSQRTYRAAM